MANGSPGEISLPDNLISNTWCIDSEVMGVHLCTYNIYRLEAHSTYCNTLNDAYATCT